MTTLREELEEILESYDGLPDDDLPHNMEAGDVVEHIRKALAKHPPSQEEIDVNEKALARAIQFYQSREADDDAVLETSEQFRTFLLTGKS